MKKAAFRAQGNFLWTECSQRFRTREAIVVNHFPVMFHGRFGLKLICSIMIEAKLRSCAIIEGISKVSAKIHTIQYVG